MRDYWFRVNDIDCYVEVCCLGFGTENINPFLQMARHRALREAVAALRAHPDAPYASCPGEYLTLTAEHGWITARIEWCDALPCRMAVEHFCCLVEDYLAEYEEMLRRRD